jgi:hypothetical protein
MTASRKPAVITAVLVAGLFALLFFRAHGWKFPSSPAHFIALSLRSAKTPEDTIYAMLDAARTGNTAQYVDSFSGTLRQQIQQAVRESGKSQFASYLTGQGAQFQSVAVSIADQPSDLEARVRVEYVYTNRNEVQVFHLRNETGQWKITGISATDQIRTLIPYGTAVTDD